MNCNTCNKKMAPVSSGGADGKFILFDLNQKNESNNFPTKDGLVLDAFLCSSCGEYKFRAPKQ